MKRRALSFTGVLFALVIGCSDKGITQINGGAAYTDLSANRVLCSCTLAVSDEAQKYAGFPATILQTLSACLPTHFLGNEDAFCRDSVTPWARLMGEQLAFTLRPGTDEAYICGGTATVLNKEVDELFTNASHCEVANENGAPSTPDARCKTSFATSSTCLGFGCRMTTDPNSYPSSAANCLISGVTPDFAQCGCTKPAACRQTGNPICGLPDDPTLPPSGTIRQLE
jgi:hypothetical protein